ncbi:carbohydrate-binding module family 13 protein [Collybiopsis luxurians FD-317 M1]|uniref:Carbohydrate-binding module family 13 protein n=1 Tax=Collybiopsis luxurians FD-317 M1 TaxID=944289 RepID=A0A0D0CSC3_9AGAR|nr:carbohydrate-binding module family 13 protein [Collybiopsis luxurians FD-317 M1]
MLQEKTIIDPELTLKPGIYRLINVQSNTALDLSEGDGRTFIGWTKHGNSNQQFIFIPLGHGGGYVIQSAWNGNYITVEDGICTGVSVVGNAFPVTWVLEECPQWIRGERISSGEGSGRDRCFRIRWPNSRYVVDLEGYGCARDGTKIQLAYEQDPVHPCQIWRFEEVCRASVVSDKQINPLAYTFGMKTEEDDGPDEDDFFDASEDGVLVHTQNNKPSTLSRVGITKGRQGRAIVRTTTSTTTTTTTYTV